MLREVHKYDVHKYMSGRWANCSSRFPTFCFLTPRPGRFRNVCKKNPSRNQHFTMLLRRQSPVRRMLCYLQRMYMEETLLSPSVQARFMLGWPLGLGSATRIHDLASGLARSAKTVGGRTCPTRACVSKGRRSQDWSPRLVRKLERAKKGAKEWTGERTAQQRCCQGKSQEKWKRAGVKHKRGSKKKEQARRYGELTAMTLWTRVSAHKRREHKRMKERKGRDEAGSKSKSVGKMPSENIKVVAASVPLFFFFFFLFFFFSASCCQTQSPRIS